MQAHPKTKGKSVSSPREHGGSTARRLKLAALSTLALGVIALGLASTMWFASGDVRRHDDPSPSEPFGKVPDFGRYRPLDTLEEDEFPIGDLQRRTLIVGDIHGMFDYFQKLLDEVQYNPAVDVLIHAGDLSAKGPLHGSIGVIDYMAQHNITGVRGNHDQKVIEWRAWADWVQTLPGGKNWLEDLERRYHDAEGKGLLSNARTIKQWIKAARKNAKKGDKKYWKLIPEGWKILTDHYFVARGLSKESFEYLSGLPLKLYIPSAHAYVAHAGLLPFDPHYPADDKDHQPLAHLPKIPLGRDGKQEGRHQPEVFSNQAEAPLGGGVIQPNDLRYLQEVALITSIPQNLDPWVVLNMRSILKSGDVTRDGKTGVPWSDLWKRAMTSCAGFQDELGVNAENQPNKFSPKKSLRLPCYPASVIYGHAASRGLDLKRWSLGLDSACVREGRLTALVIGGEDNLSSHTVQSAEKVTSEYYRNYEAGSAKMRLKVHPFLFGDQSKASIASVKCSS